MTIFQFYQKEFNEVLNMQITRIGDNLTVFLSTVEPIAKVLQLPLQEAKLGGVVKMVKLFPPNLEVDSFAFHAEFCNFVLHAGVMNANFRNLDNAAKFSPNIQVSIPSNK